MSITRSYFFILEINFVECSVVLCVNIFKMKQVIIDVQGFRSDSQFIPKEVVVLSNEDVCYRFLIRPRCLLYELTRKQQENAKWLMKNFHDLDWADGTINYKSVQNFIVPNLTKNTIERTSK